MSSVETALVLGSVIIFTLLLSRLVVVTRALRSSNRVRDQVVAHQLVLSEAAVGLAAAGDLDTVATTAVRAAMALADDPGAWSVFSTITASGSTTVAVGGPAPARVGHPFGPEAGAMRHDSDSGRFAVAVRVDGQIRGELLVRHRAPDAEAFLTTLRLIGIRAGLALQSAEAAEEQLQRSERKFRSLVQNSSDAVTLLGPDGVILYQSAGGRSVLGLQGRRTPRPDFVPLTHPDDAALSRAQFIEVLRGGPGARAHFECRLRHADGSWRQLETILTNLLSDPDVGAIVSNSRDVTERRALEQQLSHQAFHDSSPAWPTGPCSSTAWPTPSTVPTVWRDPVAVMFVDIDDFKMVNDSLGHHLGDRCSSPWPSGSRIQPGPATPWPASGGTSSPCSSNPAQMPAAAEVVARRIASRLS